MEGDWKRMRYESEAVVGLRETIAGIISELRREGEPETLEECHGEEENESPPELVADAHPPSALERQEMIRFLDSPFLFCAVRLADEETLRTEF